MTITKEYIRAGSKDVPLKELRKLAVHQDYRVRCRVAEHPRVPVLLLLQLACDQDAEVRIAVSEHAKLPQAALFELIVDDCADVRYAIAENHNLSVAVLSELADDENPFVSQRARRSLNRSTPASINSLAEKRSILNAL
ncbi:MAG: hypothetical protein K8F91_18260 [Candidatus Obscuribacterales bacterium]|nr:hypothetical protein [Candidatus Obscuribacterales bacterium]